ncbi:hypothetical protein HHI36_020672 [Cryptolaemus montrouzieri]|uniref:Uncharacterized protein n=1 Tax=Cryptolaemus montrouzieri TaxID=559131 RepID=A0ABD2NB01_9CUCU
MIFTKMMRSYSETIKTEMMSRITGSINEEEFLDRMGKFYDINREIITINIHFNELWNPALLLWSISTLTSLVLNCYNIVLLFDNKDSENSIGIHIRTYVSFAAIFSVIVGSGDIIDISDDTLSFLFKYPICKLSEPEAHQVEMLIYTLSTHKPIIRASDIFTVRTELLASISGTVVTYVLVALQFTPAWKN